MSFVRALRTLPKARAFSTAADKSAYEKNVEAVRHHAAGTTELWRRISIYGCLPAIAICCAWVYNVEVKHAAHKAHEKHEHGDKEPVQYEYMNRRTKPFPWGNNTLFFNPAVNKDMNEVDE